MTNCAITSFSPSYMGKSNYLDEVDPRGWKDHSDTLLYKVYTLVNKLRLRLKFHLDLY